MTFPTPPGIDRPATASAAASGPTHVGFLLDNTGSMKHKKAATIEGFNAYLDGLAADGSDYRVSLVKFASHNTHAVCTDAELAAVPRLTVHNYTPDGGTPLIRAMIDLIEETARRVEPKAKVIVVAQTDGEENDSGPGYSNERLKALIKAKEEAGWAFVFLGAGLDAFAIAQAMGISHAHTVAYQTDVAHTRGMFASAAASTARYSHTHNAASASFSIGERQAAGDTYHQNYAGTGGATTAGAGVGDGAPTAEKHAKRKKLDTSGGAA